MSISKEINEQNNFKLEKDSRNIEYLKVLDESDRQLASGKVIEKTMEELETMATE